MGSKKLSVGPKFLPHAYGVATIHMTGNVLRLAHALMAMPMGATDPFVEGEPAPSVKDPNLAKTKAGLLLLIVAIIISSILAIVRTDFPGLLDPRLSYVPTVLTTVFGLAGAVLVFAGRRAWPTHKRTATTGLALILVGLGSATALGLLGPSYLFSFQGQSTGVGSPYHRALLLIGVWDLINVTLLTIGGLLLVWRIVSDTPRRLIVAGNVLFLAHYLLASGVVWAFFDPSFGAAQPVFTILLGLLVVILLLSGALEVFGLVFARWRLPPPAAMPDPPPG